MDTAAEVGNVSVDYQDSNISILPMYTCDVVEPNARPSSPQEFAKLFPSLNRLSIRHDEFTPDGNMSLRIDTVVTGRRRTAIQLFHLRMYDLAKREFSLRRYCRDSGREVCNSKRLYAGPASCHSTRGKHQKKEEKEESNRPSLQRSMSSAFKSLGGKSSKQPSIRRTISGGSFFSSKSSSTKSSKSSKSSGYGRDFSPHGAEREFFADDESRESLGNSRSITQPQQLKAEPTNTIKLRFWMVGSPLHVETIHRQEPWLGVIPSPTRRQHRYSSCAHRARVTVTQSNSRRRERRWLGAAMLHVDRRRVRLGCHD
jgi:hypothetical protein